jgi:hypothetical protein
MSFTLTKDMALLLVDGREYRVAYAMPNGEWDVINRFWATDDDAANEIAEVLHPGSDWYVLDRDGRNINGGDQS